MRKVVLAGGSGFLGRILSRWFAEQNCDVVVLSRSPSRSTARSVAWDGSTLGAWRMELDGAGVLVNLAGRSVNCRYTPHNRREMLRSRVDSTRVLAQAVAACPEPPRVWLNSSTATIYKHSYDTPMAEATGVIAGTAEAKDAFSVEVAQAWEQAFFEPDLPRTRRVALRTGLVLGHGRDGVFHVLRRLTRFGLGGTMAGGRQYVSWIHELDFCRAIDWLIERNEVQGAVNVVAPNPIPNAEMMRLFRKACGRSIGLPATRWMLEIGALLMRTETELILKSRRVVPALLLEGGFEFRFPELSAALNELV